MAVANREVLAVSWSDGGGKISTARNPIFGSANVTRLVLALMSKARADTRIEIAEVNGAPGLLVFSGAALSYVGTFAIMNERIQAIL